MFHEKLNEMRPYVTGIRFVKDLPVVDVVLLEGWDMFESDTVSYKLSSNNKNYFMVFSQENGGTIDRVIEHVQFVIDFNIEKENKLSLLKAKIEELKFLFSEKSLHELEKLRFVMGTVDEPTLKDISNTPKIHNGVELPPTKENVLIEE
jgi:hypothetical protein